MSPRSGDDELTVEALASPDALRADWEALAEVNGNVFATFEFASAWLDRLGEGESALPAACRRRDGTTAAILPLVVAGERGLRVARLIGHGPADRLAPLCAAEERPLVAAATRDFLLAGDCDLFIGEQMPAEEGWTDSLGATVLEREASPVLRIDGLDWEAFLKGRSSNFRGQVRSRERRLAKRGELRFRMTASRSEVDRDMETMFALHDARWQAGGSTAFAGARRELHRAFAASALDRGWLRLWFLELDGRDLAAWYGFRFGDADWFYQSGRDPAFDSDAVGFVLLSHTVREATNDGMREYRLLRGDEAYKARFADDDPGLETIGLGLSARGRTALLSRRARPHVGRALRRLRRPPEMG